MNRLLQTAIDQKNEDERDKAMKTLRGLIRRYPTCAPAHGLLGGILFDLKKPKQAEAYFRTAAELAPKSEAASLGLFHSLWRQDRLEEALEEIKRFQVLTNWSCQDYLDIMEEIKEKWLTEKPAKKTKTGRREKKT